MIIRILVWLVCWVGLVACGVRSDKGADMRRCLNLNVTVELCDNDNLTMEVREVPGSLTEPGDGPNPGQGDDEEDALVFMATLHYIVGSNGTPLDSVLQFLGESMDRWLDMASESIAIEQEKWAARGEVNIAFQKQELQRGMDEARERAETWVCHRCEFVNVIDDRCARCDVARKAEPS